MNNISVANSFNRSQYSQTKQSQPSFRSCMPVKVFVNDKLVTDKKIVEKAFRRFGKVLFEPAKDAGIRKLKTAFAKKVRDYSPSFSKSDKARNFRAKIDGSEISYLFTGPEAKSLDAIAREFGPAKARGKRMYGHTHTAEVSSIGAAYGNKIIECMIKPYARVKKFINKDTKAYEGYELGLHLRMKCNGKLNDKSALLMDEIQFRKITK